jgi:hypothetical protein
MSSFGDASDTSHLPAAPTPSSSYALMDVEMRTLLYNETLTDVDKWILYKLVLQRYLRKLHNHKLARLRFVRMHAEDNSDANVGIERPDGDIERTVQPSVTHLKNFTTSASAVQAHLLFSILEKSQAIAWDTLGRVSIMGFPTGAFIKDYIATSMRRQTSQKPPGWELYVNCLKSQKIPHSFVKNLELQNVLKTQEPSTEDAIPVCSTSGWIDDKRVHFSRENRWKPY